MKNKIVTWNKTGFWTLAMALLGILTGIVLMKQRVFLVPPLVPYTIYFYIAIALFPAFGAFIVCARRHPVGPRNKLISLPVFVIIMLCFYLLLIAPAFYTNIQCLSTEKPGFLVQQECQCEHEPSGSKIQTPCMAEHWWPLPLMRLVEENR